MVGGTRNNYVLWAEGEELEYEEIDRAKALTAAAAMDKKTFDPTALGHKLRGPVDPVAALREERARLVARLAEIDAALEGDRGAA